MLLPSKSGVWFILFKQDKEKKFWIGASNSNLEHVVTSKMSQMNAQCYSGYGSYYLPAEVRDILKKDGYKAIEGIYCVPIVESSDLKEYNRGTDTLKYFVSKLLVSNGYSPCTTQHREWLKKKDNWFFMYASFIYEVKKDNYIAYSTGSKYYDMASIINWQGTNLLKEFLIAENSLTIEEAGMVENKQLEIVKLEPVKANTASLKINDELKELLKIEAILQDITVEELIRRTCVSDKAVKIKQAMAL